MITHRRTRGALGAVLGVGVIALAACGGGDSPDPAPTTTTTTPTTSPSTPVDASPTSSGPSFDCTSVQTAQDALDEAYSAELDDLGIRRGDPQAQSVLTIVTTNEGPTYYAAVLAAAPPDASQDAQVVLDYYQRLSAAAGPLDAGTGSAEDLAAAMDALDDATLSVNPDASAATQVVEAQERLQAALEAACSTGATQSPTDEGEASPTEVSPTSTD